MTTPQEVAALIRAIARGEPPAPARAARPKKKPRVVSAPARHKSPATYNPPKARKPRRFIPRAHEGSPSEVLEGEEATGGEITTFGSATAAAVLADVRAELAPSRQVDPVIAAAAPAVEARRAQAAADEAKRAELINAGAWVGSCKVRDAESGLQCGLLAGHHVATAKRPATRHRTARGEFVRELAAGARPGRAGELEQWAQDRRDVGDIAP